MGNGGQKFCVEVMYGWSPRARWMGYRKDRNTLRSPSSKSNKERQKLQSFLSSSSPSSTYFNFPCHFTLTCFAWATITVDQVRASQTCPSDQMKLQMLY